MQLRSALQQGLKTLLAHHVPSAELATELLLMHALGCDRGYLHAHPEAEVPPESLSRYVRMIEERSTGKPTQYITGHQGFWGLDFEVTPDVLIPRPETEHVVERVLELAARAGHGKDSPLRTVDVGTGSGCIALALAHEFRKAEIYATDISESALAVARANAQRLGMADRVTFLECDLLDCFLDDQAARPKGGESLLNTFDFVVSNPPYVGRDELDSVQREVREFEPRLAWGGLEQGDVVYRRLLPQAHQALKPGGYVVVEIGYNMHNRVLALLGAGWTEVDVHPDLAGIPRVVIARKPPGASME